MDMLGIFVKQPIPGKVKTRLATTLGADQAAKIYQAFQLDTIDRFRETGDRRFLCYAPRHELASNYFAEQGGADFELWVQPEESLGDRMHQFFVDAFSQQATHVVVIGSDSPTLPMGIMKEAFVQLEQYDIVLGPATDGGFYLIGQRAKPHSIFEEIQWSLPTVLSQIVQNIKTENATLSLLSPWYDVDTQEDLLSLEGHLHGLQHANALSHMNRTIHAIKTEQGGRTEG